MLLRMLSKGAVFVELVDFLLLLDRVSEYLDLVELRYGV